MARQQWNGPRFYQSRSSEEDYCGQQSTTVTSSGQEEDCMADAKFISRSNKVINPLNHEAGIVGGRVKREKGHN